MITFIWLIASSAVVPASLGWRDTVSMSSLGQCVQRFTYIAPGMRFYITFTLAAPFVLSGVGSLLILLDACQDSRQGTRLVNARDQPGSGNSAERSAHQRSLSRRRKMAKMFMFAIWWAVLSTVPINVLPGTLPLKYQPGPVGFLWLQSLSCTQFMVTPVRVKKKSMFNWQIE